MEEYYEITVSEADLITKFATSDCTAIDPYCGLQTNGNYIIRVEDVEECASHPNIFKVDFTSKTKKTINDLDFEPE